LSVKAEVEVEVVLDKHSMIIYRCQPKPRKFRNLKDDDVILPSAAFCFVDRDTNNLWVGYEYLDPDSRHPKHLCSEQENQDLTAAFQAMLVLDCLDLVTPYTPTKTLFETKSEEEELFDLVEWIGERTLGRIKQTDPPEVKRVSAFLEENRARFVKAMNDDDADEFFQSFLS